METAAQTTEPHAEPVGTKRAQFVAKLQKLRTDVEAKVRENPLAALGVALGIGLMIGASPRRGLMRVAMFLGGELLIGDLPRDAGNGAPPHSTH